MSADPNKARDLFVHAVGRLPPEVWGDYVAGACAGDADLERQVNDLLRAHRDIGSFLDRPIGDLDRTATFGTNPPGEPAPRQESVGAAIGPYKLVERIGDGGFGVVYLAEQTEPVRRRVALKMLKLGMDTRQVVARFEQERQALALMDHPNIAKVLDGGATPGGQPYFVMELVKGVPITRYCDDHRLPPRERLQLFVQACQAVRHAHTKGVIHRDIKPSNVLVAPYDGRPVVKVIDFGVAKAVGQPLTEKTLVTGFGAIVGTPEYMSPEQAEVNNQDIDTRSDVYALGVLLYELLTGTTPVTHERAKDVAILEVLRIIREEEPPKPSSRLSTLGRASETVSANRASEPRRLSDLIRGDLDWIVMKALEKDRNRRYETVSAIAQDVHRYLSDEPVLARPPSVGYRLGKFLKRNRGPVLAASLVLFALLGGGVGVAFGSLWHQAEVARGEAVSARDGEAQAKREAEAAREKLAAVEYGRTIQVAHQEWRDNNVPAIRALLDSTRADLRGWEWRYVYRLFHSDLVTIKAHTLAVWSASFSPDGSRLVTAGAPRRGCGTRRPGPRPSPSRGTPRPSTRRRSARTGRG